MANIPLAERVGKKLKEIVDQMGSESLRVGFFGGTSYPDGTPVASVAFWNEFGTTRTTEEGSLEHSPPRPFFRTMVAEKSPEWPGQVAALAKANNYNGPVVLALMGEKIEGDLKESINKFTDPPNAASTIKAKGFDKPLIESSNMVNSTGYEVVKK